MYKNHYVCKVNHFFVTNKEKAKKAKKKGKKSNFLPLYDFCHCYYIRFLTCLQRYEFISELTRQCLGFFCPECKLVTIFLARGVGDVQIM